MADLSNLQALVNILVNGTEVSGVGGGGGLLFTSFIPFASGLKGYSSKIAMLAVGMIVLGLIPPGLQSWIIASGKDSGAEELAVGIMLVFAGVVALVMLCASIAAYFLPAIIANREKNKIKQQF